MFCTFIKNIHYPKNIQFENKFILYIFHPSPHTIVYILQTEMYIINLRSSYSLKHIRCKNGTRFQKYHPVS